MSPITTHWLKTYAQVKGDIKADPTIHSCTIHSSAKSTSP